MQTKQLVLEAGKALKSHALGKLDHIHALWAQVSWRQSNLHWHDAQMISEEPPAIRLYSVLENMPPMAAKAAVLREFGELVLRRGHQRSEPLWCYKLGLPSQAQVDGVQARLADPEHRARIKSYKELVESFPRCMDRLTAINLVNSLIANRIPYSDSHGIDLRTWGLSEEYSNQRRYHSFASVISAYAPPDVVKTYGKAFAEAILNQMRCVSESSVAQAMQDLVMNVAEKAA